MPTAATTDANTGIFSSHLSSVLLLEGIVCIDYDDLFLQLIPCLPESKKALNVG